MKIIDLHTHSTCSDGTYTPTELVQYALDKSLSAIALTDHDTTEGIAEAFTASEKTDLEIIPGIEFSTTYNEHEIHILGFFVPFQDSDFQKKLYDFREQREIRNEKMIQKLQEKGMSFSMKELHHCFPDAVITRAHFAQYMTEHGYIKYAREAFDRYIGNDGPCYVSREKITPQQAIDFLLEHNSIPVLAHPLLYPLSKDELELLIKDLAGHGLLGLEAIYSCNTHNDENAMRRIAAKYKLLLSGGSDFHGSRKPTIDLGTGRANNLKIPYSILESLRAVVPHPIMFS